MKSWVDRIATPAFWISAEVKAIRSEAQKRGAEARQSKNGGVFFS